MNHCKIHSYFHPACRQCNQAKETEAQRRRDDDDSGLLGVAQRRYDGLEPIRCGKCGGTGETEHSEPGGPVVASGLKLRQGKIGRLPCGCSSDDTRWLTYCTAVAAQVSMWRVEARTRRIDPLLA